MASLSAQQGSGRHLPVMVSCVKKYPEFQNLLKILTKHIEDDGTTVDMKQNLYEVQDSLRQEKLQYYHVIAVHEELQSLLLDHEIDKVDHVVDRQSMQLYKTAKEVLTAAEVSDHLDFNPEVSGCGVTLLGLTAEQLKGNHDSHKMILQQGLIPELENRLKAKCEHIVQYHESSKQQGDSKFAFAKATQLPGMLEAEKRSLQEQKKLLWQDRLVKNSQFLQYYQTLLNSFEVYEKLITEHKLEWQKKYNHITRDWLGAKCQAMCFKIKVLQNQLLCDTYTSDTVAALTEIRASLQQKEKETRQELNRVVQSLQAYRSVGMGFENLVENYGQLLSEIDNKKWALTELRQSEHDMNDLWK